MISFNRDSLIRIELSAEEKQAILQHCKLLAPYIRREIEMSFGQAVCLVDEETDILLTALLYSIQEIKSEKIKFIFNIIANRIPLIGI